MPAQRIFIQNCQAFNGGPIASDGVSKNVKKKKANLAKQKKGDLKDPKIRDLERARLDTAEMRLRAQLEAVLAKKAKCAAEDAAAAAASVEDKETAAEMEKMAIDEAKEAYLGDLREYQTQGEKEKGVPESLEALIFYNAPWIFSGFWKLIHGILDPVVASKVHFISGAKELEKLVPPEHIIKELGGAEDWEYSYVEPDPHENDRLRDTATRDILLAERNKLVDELFRLTCEWIAAPQDEGVRKSRDEVIRQLQENYWKVDPYVRARGLMDRTGVIQEGGRIDFYPEMTSPAKGQTSVHESQYGPNATPTPATTTTTNGEAKGQVMQIEHAGEAPAATAVTA